MNTQNMPQTKSQVKEEKRLIIVPSISPNMFRKLKELQIRPKFEVIYITSEEELRRVLNEYDVVISYHRHEPTMKYLRGLRSDVIERPNEEYIYEPRFNEDLLGISLSKRPQKGATDVQISTFDDLAITLFRTWVV